MDLPSSDVAPGGPRTRILSRGFIGFSSVAIGLILVGFGLLAFGRTALARGVLEAGVTVLIVSPLILLVWLSTTLWSGQRRLALYGLGAVAASLIGALIALNS